jgi:hypothetical protein
MIICVTALVIASLPLLSSARSNSTFFSTSVNIVNNSSREIRNVYLSHVDADDWGNNQLGTSTIAVGQSYNLTISSWDQNQIKVVGEDQDGCFTSTVVTRDQSATWTINHDTARDCGY